jgi:hypothetical protein
VGGRGNHVAVAELTAKCGGGHFASYESNIFTAVNLSKKDKILNLVKIKLS